MATVTYETFTNAIGKYNSSGYSPSPDFVVVYCLRRGSA